MRVIEALSTALDHYKRGQLPRAEQICRQILGADSTQVDAWHLLGVVNHQSGRKEAGIQYLQEAIRRNPNLAQIHCNLGNMLRETGRSAEAVVSFRRCLELDPSYPEAQFHLGSALNDLGQRDAAIEAFRQAICIQPDHTQALNAIGVALIKRGQHAEAVPLLERALALNPAHVIGRANLSIALRELGRLDEAIAHCQQALKIDPSSYDALLNLGAVLMSAGRYAEAATTFEKAVQSSPTSPHGHVNLGGALFKLERYEEALTHLQKARAIDPQHCDALNNLGSVYLALQRYEEAADVLGDLLKLDPGRVNGYRERGVALRELGRLEEAVAHCQKAVALDPTRYEALKSLAVAYLYQGRIEPSVEAFDRALVARPHHPDGHADRAMAYLTAGDYRRGWAEYEWRMQASSFTPRSMTGPAWNGEDLQGKSILVFAEQGLGDSLQFVRYLPLVKERGARVLFECPKGLHPLLAQFPGIDKLVAAGESLPDSDVQSPLLSLPHRLNLPEPKDSPAPPYLSADPELIARWKEELDSLNGLKVGINWQGSPIHKSDRFRSIPFSHFLPLAKLPGVRLISLQKGFGREQLFASEESHSILDLGSRLDEKAGAFMDTAAALHSLDLVITSDTALAHLAGALGRPVWVALSAVPDWRWLLQGETTAWYPSMRLYRQKGLGDWSTVFARLAFDLQSLIGTGATDSCGQLPITGMSHGVLGKG